MRALLVAVVASVALVGAYVALGGGDFEPSRPPDPCTLRASEAGGTGLTETLQRVGLNALAGSACDLGVTRERLLLALTGDTKLGIDSDRRTEAFRAGLGQAIDAEVQAGRLGDTQALLLRQAIQILPVDAVLDRLFGEGL